MAFFSSTFILHTGSIAIAIPLDTSLHETEIPFGINANGQATVESNWASVACFFCPWANNIRNEIVELSETYNLFRCEQTGLPIDLRHEILLGYKVDLPFNITTSSYHGSILKAEHPGNVLILDFEGYADLLCYASMVRFNEGNHSGATYYYVRVKEFWDGNGFRDKAYHGYYSTYKLALFYYLHNIRVRVLGKDSFDFEDTLFKRIWQCQSETGDFKTEYYAN